MAKTKLEPTADAQIETLRRLSQKAVGWLCDLTPRSIRDAYLPRAADGTYSARDVLTWAASRSQRSGNLSDDDMESLARVAGALLDDPIRYSQWPTIVATIRDLQARYGDAIAVDLIEVLLAHAEPMVSDLADAPDPTEAELRERKAERQRQRRMVEARAALRIAVICPNCGKMRRGPRWVTAPVPADHAVDEMTCPQCSTPRRPATRGAGGQSCSPRY